MGVHDLRTHQLAHKLSLATDGPLAVPSILHHADDPHSLYAAAGNCVYQLDLRQVAATTCMCIPCHSCIDDELHALDNSHLLCMIAENVAPLPG